MRELDIIEGIIRKGLPYHIEEIPTPMIIENVRERERSLE